MALLIGHRYRVKTIGFLGKEYGIKWGTIMKNMGGSYWNQLEQHIRNIWPSIGVNQ